MHSPAYQQQNGYTLLEMLVVMLLIGLIAGLVLPNLSKLYDSGILAYERNNLLRSLSAISYHVYRQGQAIRLGVPAKTEDANARQPIVELPEGWVISADEPIVYRDNGVCLGGELTLIKNSLVQHIRLIPPFCQAIPVANHP